jgi:rhodanese-related sulfurtransferase
MKQMISHLLGGLAILLLASVAGMAVNAARPDGIALVQKIEAIKTAQHGDADTTTTDGSDAANPAEGSITVAQMKAAFDDGVAVIIDARAPDAFTAGHIPGAVNIPYDQLPSYLETLEIEAPRDGLVICYCWSPSCDFSDQLGTELKLLGYEDIQIFTGGWEHWTEAGHPTEEGDE